MILDEYGEIMVSNKNRIAALENSMKRIEEKAWDIGARLKLMQMDWRMK